MAQRKQIAVIVLVGACAILIGFVLGDLTGFKYGKGQNKAYVAEVSSPLSLPVNPSSPAFDLSSIEIMKELNCVCGCDMELQPCTCDKQRGVARNKKVCSNARSTGPSQAGDHQTSH